MTIFEEIQLALQQAIEYEQKDAKNVQICVKIAQDFESGGTENTHEKE